MFRLVFVILRTKNRLILCHFPHCLLFLVFFMKVGYCCVYIITCSCFFKFQYWLDVNKTVAHQKKRESLYVCVCHCVCVGSGGWSGGMHECLFMFILFQILESTCMFKMLQVLYWEKNGKLLTLFLKVWWRMWKEEVRIIVKKDRMKPL